MLRMCGPIFGTGESVVLESGFWVYKVITDLKDKVLYTGALIMKWCYWLEGVTGDLMDTHFQDK